LKLLIHRHEAVGIHQHRNPLRAVDAVVIPTVAANTGVAQQILAVHHLPTFRALAPKAIPFVGLLIHLADVLTLTAVSEPVEQTQG
jgi:hypothetical protein